MALKQNNAEGMATGSTVAASQSGSGDAFSLVTIAGSATGIYDNAAFAHGSQSYHLSGAASTTFFMNLSGGGVTAGAIRFYLRMTSATGMNIVEMRDTAGSQNAALGFNSNRQLQVKDAAGAVLTTFSTALALNTWYRIELQMTVGTSTTTGSIASAYYLGDATTPLDTMYSSSSVNSGTANNSYIRIGKITPAATLDAYFDDIAWNNGSASAIGPVLSNQAPTSNAGTDQANLEPYTVVTLVGSDGDSDGTVASRAWRQVAGSPTVTLSNSASAISSYIAPGTLTGTTLTFGYTVTDNDGISSSESTVQHTILSATERAIIGGVEVPIQTKPILNGISKLAQVWTAQATILKRRGYSNPISNDFIIGTTKPSALNTGPRISNFTVVNGDYTASIPNSIVSGLDIHGFLKVTANNVTIEDCIIRGRGDKLYVNTFSPALVNFDTTMGGVVQFCEVFFDASQPGAVQGYFQNGIRGNNFTSQRNDIHDVVDHHDAQGTGAYHLRGNYIHDLSFRSDDTDHDDDPRHPYWSHSDGIQDKGSANAEIIGNFFAMYESSLTSVWTGPGGADARRGGSPYGSGVTISSDNGTTTGITIAYNWFWGGDSGFQCNLSSASPGRIYGNRVSNDQWPYNGTGDSRYQLRWGTGVTMVCPNLAGDTSGLDMNIWDPDGPGVSNANKGQPLTVGYYGGIRIG